MASTRRTAGSAAVALASLLTILGIAFAAPVALLHFGGNPIPRSLPGGHHLETLITTHIPNGDWPHFLAEIGWLFWLWLIAGMAVQAVLMVAGREGRRIPLLGPTQFLGALIFVPLLSFASHGASYASTVPASAMHRPAATASALVRHVAPQASVDYVVKPGDTLWSIAEAHFGDPEAWHSIWRANAYDWMEEGEQFSNPSLIEVGWTLKIPAVAATSAPIPVPAVMAAPRAASVQSPPEETPVELPAWLLTPIDGSVPAAATPRAGRPSDELPSDLAPAAAAPETASARVAAPSGAPLLPSELTPAIGGASPETALPDALLPSPALPHVDVAPAAPSVARAPALPQELAPKLNLPEPSTPAIPPKPPTTVAKPSPAPMSSSSRGSDLADFASVLGTGALLAGGLLVALDRRRRLRRAELLPGEIGVSTSDDLARAEKDLRRGHPEALVRDIEALIGHLDLVGSPPLLAVRAVERGIELVVAPGTELAKPFFRTSAGFGIQRPVDAPQRRSTLPTLPALVSIGEDQRGSVLVNLEEQGAVAVEGPREQVRDIARAIVTELTWMPWSTLTSVYVFGDLDVVATDDRVQSVEDAGDLLVLAEHERSRADEAISTSRGTTAQAARAAGTLDGCTVVVCADPVGGLLSAELCHAARAGRGIVVIFLADAPDGAQRWALGREWLDVPGIGSIRPTALPERHVELVRETIAQAEIRETFPLDDVATEIVPAVPQRVEDGTTEGNRIKVRVELLGPFMVKVDGEPVAMSPLERRCMACLALHGSGIDNDVLADVLWPGRTWSDFGRLDKLMWRLRSLLGGGEGADLFLRGSGRTSFNDAVVRTDFAEFKSLSISGAADDVVAAVDLVRGVPLADAGLDEWDLLYDQVGQFDAAITAVFDRSIKALLDRGDLVAARRVTRRGRGLYPEMQWFLARDIELTSKIDDMPSARRLVEEYRRQIPDVPVGSEVEALLEQSSAAAAS